MQIIYQKEKDIIHSYNYCKKLAFDANKKGNFEKSLHLIQLSARIAYNFNWIYSDNDLEQLLRETSQYLLKPTIDYQLNKNKYVFYDSFSTDNRALTQQYIRALISLECEFLYITESTKDNKQGKYIFTELRAYNKAEIFEVPQNISSVEQIISIYNKIIAYRPDKLLIHIHPWSVNAIMAFYALPKEITKYKINLTDHAFWLGNKCLDYSIEFRAYGCTLSREKRGINEDQLLLLPYYPIVSEYSFQGFPVQCTKDKVIILSGGSVYKVYGRNGEFFNLVKRILDDNPNTVFLFAGAGDMTPMENFIKKNNFRDRFIAIGNREDINEVFKNCDIYMGTYPIAGGLMSQFAALNGKPILAFSTSDLDASVESLVCHNGSTRITFTEKELFFDEAKHLIENTNYRRQKGDEIKSFLITKEQFTEQFKSSVKLNKTQYQFKDESIDYYAIFKLYIEIENKFQFDYKKLILNNFKLRSIYLFPKIFAWFILYFLSRQDWKMVYRKTLLKLFVKEI